MIIRNFTTTDLNYTKNSKKYVLKGKTKDNLFGITHIPDEEVSYEELKIRYGSAIGIAPSEITEVIKSEKVEDIHGSIIDIEEVTNQADKDVEELQTLETCQQPQDIESTIITVVVDENTPNKETLKAIEDSEQDIDMTKCLNSEDMFSKLGIDVETEKQTVEDGEIESLENNESKTDILSSESNEINIETIPVENTETTSVDNTVNLKDAKTKRSNKKSK
jgi:hypothetical protein